MPLESSVAHTSAPLEIARRPEPTSSEMENTALRSGSSQQGNALLASVDSERAAIEATELVVQHAGEIALEDARARQDLAGRGEADALEILVETDVEDFGLGRVIGPAQRGIRDLKLRGVANDRASGGRDVELDPLVAEKCRGVQVRHDRELVARRYDVAGEPEVALVGVQSHGHRRLAVAWLLAVRGVTSHLWRLTGYGRDSCRSPDHAALPLVRTHREDCRARR